MKLKSKKPIILSVAVLLAVSTIAWQQWIKANTEKMEKENWQNLIRELPADAYLKIADLNIVVPLVALLEPRYAYAPYSFSPWGKVDKQAQVNEQKQFREQSAKPETPLAVNRVQILIAQYQFFGERLSSDRICPRLKRDWAKYFCRGQHLEIMKKLPEKFYIVDKSHIDLFASHLTVGGEKMADQIHQLNLASKTIDISCDSNSEFCTAGVQTSPSTLAVWPVWREKQISSGEVAERQGQAILAFVRHGVGVQSNFELMQKEMGNIQ